MGSYLVPQFTRTLQFPAPFLNTTAGENSPQQYQVSPLYRSLPAVEMGRVRVINLPAHSLYSPETCNTHFTTLSSCCMSSTTWPKPDLFLTHLLLLILDLKIIPMKCISETSVQGLLFLECFFVSFRQDLLYSSRCPWILSIPFCLLSAGLHTCPTKPGLTDMFGITENEAKQAYRDT